MTKRKTTFADAFGELETIARWFERDEVDVEEGLEKFERGMALAKELRQRLTDAEVRIQKIEERFGTPPESHSPAHSDAPLTEPPPF
ncbi:exodeoxyribonuclease VII small subunit [Candidatus Uhrbacteria bacterium]|nr:exodeoxyribonuclease VII small subunit [Candidatus Uhrbacteria bacterium]